MPNPFYAAYAAGAVAAHCEPVYLPATAATGFLPDLDALSDELLARTVAFYLASPANPQGAVADLGLSRAARRARAQASASWCSATSAIRRSTPGARRPACSRPRGARLRQRGRVPVAVEALEPARPARRLRRRRPQLPRALPRTAQRRRAAGADAGAARRDRRLWRRGACRGEPPALCAEIRSRRPDHRRPLRLSPAGRRILPLARRRRRTAATRR